ncbi:hypothetical protein ACFX13_031333 [Malus domestica]
MDKPGKSSIRLQTGKPHKIADTNGIDPSKNQLYDLSLENYPNSGNCSSCLVESCGDFDLGSSPVSARAWEGVVIVDKVNNDHHVFEYTSPLAL